MVEAHSYKLKCLLKVQWYCSLYCDGYSIAVVARNLLCNMSEIKTFCEGLIFVSHEVVSGCCLTHVYMAESKTACVK